MINKVDYSLVLGNYLLIGVIIIYLVIISIFSDKYNDLLSQKKIKNTLLNLNKITNDDFLKYQNLNKKNVSKQIKIVVLILSVIYIIHLSTILMVIGFSWIDLFGSTISFLVSLVMIIIIYWLKGSGTIDSNARIPGQTRI